MKKIISAAFAAGLLLIGAQAYAQFSVGVGYLSSTLSGQYHGDKIDPETSHGFYAGASYDISLPVSGLSIAPGAYFSLISNSETEGISMVSFSEFNKATFTEMAVNVPVYIKYSHALAPDSEAFVFVGPTFQFGLSSKTTVKNTGTYSFSDEFDHYERNDFNKGNTYIGGGIGAIFREKIMLVVGYNYGLTNLSTIDRDDTSCHRASFKVGVGYVF